MTRRTVRFLLCLSVLALIFVLVAPSALAAETVHLYLKVNGQNIQGESAQTSLGRENSIECMYVEHSILGADSGKQFSPVKCIKRIDKSTPLLIKALIERRPVEATFKLFRPNPTGDGTTEQFYTIELKSALITGYRMWSPDTTAPTSSTLPPMEEITFTFKAITWTYTNGNVSFGSESGGAAGKKDEEKANPGLKAEVKGRTINLSWQAVTPAAGKTLLGYNVYRSTDSRTIFVEKNRINDFAVTTTSTVDAASPGTYWYGLEAVWSDLTTTQYEPAVKAEIK